MAISKCSTKLPFEISGVLSDCSKQKDKTHFFGVITPSLRKIWISGKDVFSHNVAPSRTTDAGKVLIILFLIIRNNAFLSDG